MAAEPRQFTIKGECNPKPDRAANFGNPTSRSGDNAIVSLTVVQAAAEAYDEALSSFRGLRE
jgi:hypothetical protein